MDSVRILIWPNLSIKKDISADSAFNIINELVGHVLQHRDWHFYIATPNIFTKQDVYASFPNLKHNNVTLLPCPISSGRRLTAYEFDYKALRKAINIWEIDLDLVICMLPEYLNNLSQYLCRSRDRHMGHINVPMVAWFHWTHSFENKHEQVIDSRIAFRQLEGHLFSDETWVVSEFEGKLVNKLRDKWIPNLQKPIYEMNNGINGTEYDKYLSTPKKSSQDGIVRFLFNHRNNRYKGIDRLKSFVKNLSQIRKDFKVILKNPAWAYPDNSRKNLMNFVEKNKDFFEVSMDVDKTKPGYYTGMSQCDIQLCTSSFETWCISVAEGAYLDLPVLAPQGLTFEEMLGQDYKYLYKGKDIVELADEMITRIKNGESFGCRHLVKKYEWNTLVKTYINRIQNLVSHFRFQEYNGKKRNAIPVILEEHGKPFTKKDLKNNIKYEKDDGKMYTILPGREEANWTRQRHVLLSYGYKDDCSKSEPTFYLEEWNKD